MSIAIKDQKKANFVGIDLLKVDLEKIPQPLNVLIADLQDECRAKYDRDYDKESYDKDRHDYHSDEPRYDHTRSK